MKTLASDEQHLLVTLLQQLYHQFSISLDIWTGVNGKSYIGCLVSFIHNNELQTRLLFFVEMLAVRPGMRKNILYCNSNKYIAIFLVK
jgi:hypothetical protein